jgi:hypothetical protein
MHVEALEHWWFTHPQVGGLTLITQEVEQNIGGGSEAVFAAQIPAQH